MCGLGIHMSPEVQNDVGLLYSCPVIRVLAMLFHSIFDKLIFPLTFYVGQGKPLAESNEHQSLRACRKYTMHTVT